MFRKSILWRIFTDKQFLSYIWQYRTIEDAIFSSRKIQSNLDLRYTNSRDKFVLRESFKTTLGRNTRDKVKFKKELDLRDKIEVSRILYFYQFDVSAKSELLLLFWVEPRFKEHFYQHYFVLLCSLNINIL